MEAALDRSAIAEMAEPSEARILDFDAQLMLRFQNGDTGAFDTLFEKHRRRIINYIYRFVRNREVAEELAQEIFLKVYENASGYRAKAKFLSWLYTIATNVCLNEIRRPRFRAVHQSLDDPDRGGLGEDAVRREIATSNGPDLELERLEMERAIKGALAQIPEKQRVAFILNKYQDLSYAEVADVLKLSEKAVKSLIHRAKEALAERLEPLMGELLTK